MVTNNCKNVSKENIVKEILNNTLREIMTLIDAESGSLFLFDSDSNELVLDSFYNKGKLNLYGLRKKIGEGILGKVVTIKTPVLVKDIACDERFHGNGFTHYRSNSFISIPLFGAEGLLGLINLTDKKSEGPFSDRDLEFSVVIAKYACLSVNSLRDYMELRLEKEEGDKQKLLLEKYASVGKLAAGIVHQVNNPLDGILRYTNILLEQAEGNSITAEYLLEIKKGLNRIASITRSLLEFSQSVKPAYREAKNYVDMHKVIDESLDIFKDKLVSITVDRKYKEDMPRIADLGLSHVITNVVKNALDAMPGRGMLEISTHTDETAAMINVRDTGPGIPQEIKSRIFEPFFTTKALGKGTGLGLSICKEVVDRYEGDIRVQSDPGKGSTFTIAIPRKYLEHA